MRKSVLVDKSVLVAVACLAMLALVAPIHRAEAMTAAAPAQLGLIESGPEAAQQVRWGCGWHGCVPGWHRYYRGYPYPYPFPYFVMPRIWIQPWPGPWYGPPGYPYRPWGWRYRRWHRWHR